ncbi:MAG: hypothetical protein H7Z72_10380 [Bacteroidetes bacterium]|nr:hypothetical protein [Fibrella sp.]
MRPIIEYHGPLFQWLCRLTMRLGHDRALLLWQLAVVVWLLSISSLVVTKRFSGVFTVLTLAGIALLRLPGLGLVELNVDESQWIVSAATLVHDPRFWYSVDGTTSGPVNVGFPALVYYLGFSLDYTTLRLWGLLTCVVPTAWLLLATFRHQFGERLARLGIVPVAACLALTTDADGVAFGSEQLPMLLLALVGYLLSRLFSETAGRGPSAGGLLVLGCVLGCFPYTKLQATPIGLVIAIWVLVGLLTGVAAPAPHRFRRVGGFVAGGLLPTVLVGVYLLVTGLTDYAIRSYILVNLEYAQAGSWGGGAVSWADRWLVRLPRIYGDMPTTRWFWWLALVLGVLYLINRGLRSDKASRPDQRLWFTLSVCAVSLYATGQPGNLFAHYQWLSFVPVSWLMGQLINGLVARPERPPLPSAPTHGLRAALVVGVLMSSAYPGWLAVSRPNAGIGQLASGGWRSALQPVSEAIQLHAQPNERMVVWGWANNLHVETGLLMGSRFIPLYFPVVPGPQQAYFLDVYRQDLLINRPAIIVDALALHPGKAYDRYPIQRYPSIQAILDTRYRLVETVNGAKIYALRK